MATKYKSPLLTTTHFQCTRALDEVDVALNGETRYAEPVRGLLNTGRASIRALGEAPSEAVQDDPAFLRPGWCPHSLPISGSDFCTLLYLRLALGGHSGHRGAAMYWAFPSVN